jgi:hypothetical protein
MNAAGEQLVHDVALSNTIVGMGAKPQAGYGKANGDAEMDQVRRRAMPGSLASMPAPSWPRCGGALTRKQQAWRAA